MICKNLIFCKTATCLCIFVRPSLVARQLLPLINEGYLELSLQEESKTVKVVCFCSATFCNAVLNISLELFPHIFKMVMFIIFNIKL